MTEKSVCGEFQSTQSNKAVTFTWSFVADVGESISDVGSEHSSMFSERGSTGEERVVQGLCKENKL